MWQRVQIEQLIVLCAHVTTGSSQLQLMFDIQPPTATLPLAFGEGPDNSKYC